jgi:phosphatidylcholine synthase
LSAERDGLSLPPYCSLITGLNAPRQELEDPAAAPRWTVAWLAHVYTALGLLLAAGMGVCIVRGGADHFRWAFVAMLVACLVDATDGTLARRLHVKERLPGFDGAKLDDLVDFLTFTSLPLALIWRAELVPPWCGAVLLFALVASAYGFCQVPAKTTDGYFVGFPSYWNIVAFYLYVLAVPQWIAAVIILVLALLTFVPSYYLYPSRGATLSRLTNFLGGIWVVLLVWILAELPGEDVSRAGVPPHVPPRSWLSIISLFYPIYYVVISWVITIARWSRLRLL